MNPTAPAAAAAAAAVNEALPKQFDSLFGVVRIIDPKATADSLRNVPLDKLIDLSRAILWAIPAQNAEGASRIKALKVFFLAKEQDLKAYEALWTACGVAEGDRKFYGAAFDQIGQIDPKTKWTAQGAFSPEFAERVRQLCERAFGYAAAIRQPILQTITSNASEARRVRDQSTPAAREAERKSGNLDISDEFVALRNISQTAFQKVNDCLHRVLKPEADSKVADQLRTAITEAQMDAKLLCADYNNFAVWNVDGAGYILEDIAEEYRQHIYIPRMKAFHQYMFSVLQGLNGLLDTNQAVYNTKGVPKGKAIDDLMLHLKRCIVLPERAAVPPSDSPEINAMLMAFKAQCEAAEKLLIQELERIYAKVVKSETMRSHFPKHICKEMLVGLAGMLTHKLVFRPQQVGARLADILRNIITETTAINDEILRNNESVDRFNKNVRPKFNQAPSPYLRMASNGIRGGSALQRNLEHIARLYEVLVAVNAAAQSAAPTP